MGKIFMTIQEGKQSIGKEFKVVGFGLPKFDIIKQVLDDGTILGDMYEANCIDCRLKQEQPEQLRKNKK